MKINNALKKMISEEKVSLNFGDKIAKIFSFFPGFQDLAQSKIEADKYASENSGILADLSALF